MLNCVYLSDQLVSYRKIISIISTNKFILITSKLLLNYYYLSQTEQKEVESNIQTSLSRYELKLECSLRDLSIFIFILYSTICLFNGFGSSAA